MRDLQSIAEINGPRSKELQVERAVNILDHHAICPAAIIRAEHGRRVEARQREKGAA